MATQSPLALAIANAEGGPNSAGWALNNPGDIYSPSTGQLASYSTLQEGWNALEAQISKWINGTSAYANGDTPISDLAQTYTGGDNPTGWANSVAQSLGISPSTPISQAANAAPSQSLLSKLGQFFSGAVSGASASAVSNGITGAVTSFFTDLLTTRFVFGLLGIVLIIGGVFGFDKVQEVVQTTAQNAARAGEIAA